MRVYDVDIGNGSKSTSRCSRRIKVTTTSTNTGRLPAEIRFGLSWVVLVTIGFGLGLALGLQALWNLTEPLQRALGNTAGGALTAAAFGTIFGLCVGGAQAIAIRQRLPSPLRWVAASVIGCVVPMTLVIAIFLGYTQLSDEIGILVAGSLIGLGMGIGQWLTVRNQGQKMLGWILVSVAGMIVGWYLAFSLGQEGRELLAMAAGGLAVAAITGLGMVWLAGRSTIS